MINGEVRGEGRSMRLGQTCRAFLDRGVIRTFDLWQRLGFHVTPNHFYQPIPDTRALKHTLWTERSELVGVDMSEEAQLSLLSTFEDRFSREYALLPQHATEVPHQYYLNNGNFEAVDSEVLYCMIRHFSPRRVVEVGSGFSTLLAAQALARNREEQGVNSELVSIEPYPMPIIANGVPGLSKLIPLAVEEVPLDCFMQLEENDILFIDSSHVLRIGGDVQYEYLEIIPRLNPGVIVHVHDIFLPREYPRDWVLGKHRFWSEQYLLQAFLCFNSEFEVLWASNYLHEKHPDRLRQAFPSYRDRPRSPGSFWMRRRAEQ